MLNEIRLNEVKEFISKAHIHLQNFFDLTFIQRSSVNKFHFLMFSFSTSNRLEMLRDECKVYYFALQYVAYYYYYYYYYKIKSKSKRTFQKSKKLN